MSSAQKKNNESKKALSDAFIDSFNKLGFDVDPTPLDLKDLPLPPVKNTSKKKPSTNEKENELEELIKNIANGQAPALEKLMKMLQGKVPVMFVKTQENHSLWYTPEYEAKRKVSWEKQRLNIQKKISEHVKNQSGAALHNELVTIASHYFVGIESVNYEEMKKYLSSNKKYFLFNDQDDGDEVIAHSSGHFIEKISKRLIITPEMVNTSEKRDLLTQLVTEIYNG